MNTDEDYGKIINALGFVAKPTRWTDTTIRCYARGCICKSDCFNYSFCSQWIKRNKRPPMKATVLACVQEFGAPRGTGIVRELINEAG